MSASRSARTRAAGGLAAGSITEIFACMSSGRRPARACVGEGREHADVGDQDAAEAVVGSTERVVEAGDDLLLAAGRGREYASGRRAGRSGGVPGGIRPRKEADLDAGVGGEPGRVVELVVGEHEDSAPLRDAVDRDVEARRLLEHGLETARALGAGDLDSVLRAVGKAFRRVGQVVQHPRAGARSSEGSRASRSSGRPYLRRLSLLEQRLPPLEQPLELVARGRVCSEQLDVSPVLGEPALERGDGLLLRGDLPLDVL